MHPSQKFRSKIYKLGINPVVDPPKTALAGVFEQADRARGPIPVYGKLNGSDFTQTLVKFRGEWRLYVNGRMLKHSGCRVGDTADFEIAFDPRPRDPAVPASLADALGRSSAAATAFERLSPSRKKEILRYLGSLKTEAAVDRNIKRLIGLLSRPGQSPKKPRN